VASVSPESSVEGTIGLFFSSMGYITLVPDYPGFGASKISHPYMHAQSLVPSVVDLILATKDYCAQNGIVHKDHIFLTGYSEGGFVSLAAQKEIEQSYRGQIDLSGVAPLAGPYDLRSTYDKMFSDADFCEPAYIAFLLTAYNNIYEWNKLDEFFQAPYASLMPGLFDGSKYWWEVINVLPGSLAEMMHPDFNKNYFEDQESVVWKALSDNTLLNWVPEAPLHFFHGDCDNISYCLNAINAMEAFSSAGADVQLTLLEGENHETGGPPAINGAINWIEDFYPEL
jgi:hypothetical protein